jgi:hypothetical protein
MLCAAIRPALIRMRTSRGEVLVGGDAYDHDRLVGRVEREREDAVGAGGQFRADRIQLGAHVERRCIDIAPPVERDLERRLLGFRA